MKNNLLNILDNYLLLFPEEKERQSRLFVYLKNANNTEIADWNNFNGHIVAGGFVYAKKEYFNSWLDHYEKYFYKDTKKISVLKK